MDLQLDKSESPFEVGHLNYCRLFAFLSGGHLDFAGLPHGRGDVHEEHRHYVLRGMFTKSQSIETVLLLTPARSAGIAILCLQSERDERMNQYAKLDKRPSRTRFEKESREGATVRAIFRS